MRTARRELESALIVPDAAAWTMWGRDPYASGLQPAAAPEGATTMVVPARIPSALADDVALAWARIPGPRRHRIWDAALAGVPAESVLAIHEEAPAPQVANTEGEGGGSEAGHDAHVGHPHQEPQVEPDPDAGHDDMMAIVGEPSADGLVMEPLDFKFGPLAPGLPGGLIASLDLDGDIVAACRLQATLLSESPPGRPVADPLAPCASAAAIALAEPGGRELDSDPWWSIVAIEVERALSHLAWFRSFAGVLGWELITTHAQMTITSLGPARAMTMAADPPTRNTAESKRLRAALVEALPLVDRLQSRLDGSRLLRARTRGRGRLSDSRLEATAIGGPCARAAGLERDERIGDSAYEMLGFHPALGTGGDVEARSLVRLAESHDSIRLAVSALAASDEGEAMPPRRVPAGVATVEGPRGPLVIHAGDAGSSAMSVSAPGTSELLDLAGESMIGLELGAAVLALSSFDLSPWEPSR